MLVFSVLKRRNLPRIPNNLTTFLLDVRLAGDHLYGKLLFTWPSLVMPMMVSFYTVLSPRDVLDEILNFIESVSEVFSNYSCM